MYTNLFHILGDAELWEVNMIIKETPEYNVYQNKDGRTRVYIKSTQKIMSYPKFIMEQKLGRSLLADEEVHHIDEDFTNNDPSNLIVLAKDKHLAIHLNEKTKYYDKMMTCPICGKNFLWTAKSQSAFYRTKNRRMKRNKTNTVNDSPFCSRECAGHYSQEQKIRYHGENGSTLRS